jgi:AraC-like DNA-binding protein
MAAPDAARPALDLRANRAGQRQGPARRVDDRIVAPFKHRARTTLARASRRDNRSKNLIRVTGIHARLRGDAPNGVFPRWLTFAVTDYATERVGIAAQPGELDAACPNEGRARLIFRLSGREKLATVKIALSPYERARTEPGCLMVSCRRDYLASSFGWSNPEANEWHLTSELRHVVNSFRDCPFVGETSRTYRSAKILELLTLVGQAAEAQQLLPIAPNGPFSAADCERVVKVRELIDERFAERWTLGELAKAGGVNIEKLGTGFRYLYGMAPIQFLRARKMREARLAITTSARPISLIAYDLGYHDATSFTRAFKREFGYPPQDCRREP